MSASGSKFKFRKKLQTRHLLSLLYFSMVVAGLYFLVLNIQPYYKLTVSTSSTFLNYKVSTWLDNVIILLVSLTLWAIIQIAELFPLIAMKNSFFLRRIIERDRERTKYKIDSNDTPIIKGMKQAYNGLPTSFFRDIKTICVCVYPIDFVINCFAYPPFNGSLYNAIFMRQGFINWNNIAWNLVTVGIVEVIVLGLIWTGAMIDIFKHHEQL